MTERVYVCGALLLVCGECEDVFSDGESCRCGMTGGVGIHRATRAQALAAGVLVKDITEDDDE